MRPPALDALAAVFSPEQLYPALLSWMAASYNIYSLLDEINAGRGAHLRKLSKRSNPTSTWTRPPVQEVDLHEGLENTLVILRHKLKQGIEVRREYDPAVPRIQAYGSELNQVWTNIIDNAIDCHGRSKGRTTHAGLHTR